MIKRAKVITKNLMSQNSIMSVFLWTTFTIVLTMTLKGYVNFIQNGSGDWDGAGYFLPIAEKISNGSHIYKDITCGYAPIGILTYSLAHKLLGSSGVDMMGIYHALTFMLQISCGTLVFILLYRKTQLLPLSSLAGATFLCLAFKFQGAQIMLEGFTAFFSLGVLCLLNHNRKLNPLTSFGIGILITLAFMSKQYGIAMLPATMVCIALKQQSSTPNAARDLRWLWLSLPLIYGLVLSIGAKVPLIDNIDREIILISAPVLCSILLLLEKKDIRISLRTFFLSSWCLSGSAISFIFILQILGISFQEYINETIPLGYINNVRTSVGPFFDFGADVFIFFTCILIFFFSQKKKDFFLTSSLVIFTAFLPALAIRSFHHYFLLIIPFFTLLGFYCVFKLQESKYIFNLTAICGAIIILIRTDFSRFDNPETHRQSFEKIAREINLFIPPNGRTIIFGHNAFYYYTKLPPPDNTDGGYTFLNNYSVERLRETLVKSEYVIFDSSNQIAVREANRAGLSQVKGQKSWAEEGFKEIGKIRNQIFIYKNQKPHHPDKKPASYPHPPSRSFS